MPTPSLLIVPARFKSGKLYSQIPTSGAGDFTVTRATAATRVDASGLIEVQKTNLCLQSEAIGITSWVNTAVTASPNVSATLDPSGGNTAEKIVATAVSGNHFTTRASSTQTGQHTFSVFAKAAEYSFIRLQDLGAGKYNVWFDLLSGTANGTNASIQNYGDGWYRCIITYDGAGASVANGLVGVPTSGGGISYTGDGTSGIYVWGAQLETGSSASEYIPTTTVARTRFAGVTVDGTVATNIPRLDYLASGGTVGCPALLVEPAATNGILNSANTTTNWTLGANLTSGAIDVIGVSGNNLTVAVSGSSIGDAAGRLVRFSNNVALASGSTYTISFLMKKTGAHTIGGYILSFSPSGTIGSGFNVSGSFSSGSITDTAPTTNRIRRVEQWGIDVYRCSETFTMTAAATGTHLSFGPNNSVTVSTNSAVGTSMGFAAPQIELGSVPTSFIPTTTAAVTRNADLISVSGAVSGSIGQTEGTIYAEVDIRNLTDGRIFTLFNSATRYILLSKATNRLGGVVIDTTSSPTTVVNLQTASGSLTAGTYKLALAYASGNFAFYVNGTQVATSSTGGVIGGYTSVRLGNFDTSLFFNDRIRVVALYTTRLSNAELQSLTQL